MAGRLYLKILLAVPIIFSISCTTPGDIASLQKSVEETPESPQAHYELALAYLKHGVEWEGPHDVGIPIIVSKRWTKKAKNELHRVVELDPAFPEAHYWLKVIYSSQGRYKEADKESKIYTELTAQKKRQSKR